jgi:hypothetical protein
MSTNEHNLRLALTAMAELLESVGETHWSRSARSTMRLNFGDDLRFAVKPWFGGMGSLNDLALCKQNGFPGTAEELNRLHHRLNDLREEIFKFCNASTKSIGH